MGKRGPAPKGEYADKSAVLSTRISADLRTQLEKAVKVSGLTLSREVEHRLRRTFQEDKNAVEGFGTRRNLALMKTVAQATQIAFNPAHPDADWMDDPLMFEMVVRIINQLLEGIRPAPAPELAAFAELATIDSPAWMWRHIQQGDASLPFGVSSGQSIVNRIKAELGDVADRPKFFEGTADDMRRRAAELDKRSPLSQRPKRHRKGKGK